MVPAFFCPPIVKSSPCGLSFWTPMTIQPLHLDAVTENPIVLLGEFHGNEQGPETLWTLSERIVGPITFALEYAESDDAIFHSWINSDGTDDDRRNLLKARFWSSSVMYDGRSSVAMYRLLERIRKARQDGADHAVLTSIRVNCSGGFSRCCTERGEELVELHNNHQPLGLRANDGGDFDFIWIVEAGVPSQRWDGTNH